MSADLPALRRRSRALSAFRRRHALVLCLGAVMLGACTPARQVAPPQPDCMDVTLGRQLIELKQAHDAGALSTEEYASQKKALLDRALR